MLAILTSALAEIYWFDRAMIIARVKSFEIPCCANCVVEARVSREKKLQEKEKSHGEKQ